MKESNEAAAISEHGKPFLDQERLTRARLCETQAGSLSMCMVCKVADMQMRLQLLTGDVHKKARARLAPLPKQPYGSTREHGRTPNMHKAGSRSDASKGSSTSRRLVPPLHSVVTVVTLHIALMLCQG